MRMTFFFCSECGVNVSKTGDHDVFKGLVIIQAGSLDNQHGLEQAVPTAELYVKNRVRWVEQLSGAGQLQEFPEIKAKA
jgi:hypothetical protein